MNQEELMEYMKEAVDRDHANLLIEKFFESNVCIPKGKNRHPYADVLHEWIEGSDMEYLSKMNNTWCMIEHVRSLHNSLEYRIKRYEPVYEWQFVYIKADNTAEITRFYTDEESKDCHQFTKIEETKRERKR